MRLKVFQTTGKIGLSAKAGETLGAIHRRHATFRHVEGNRLCRFGLRCTIANRVAEAAKTSPTLRFYLLLNLPPKILGSVDCESSESCVEPVHEHSSAPQYLSLLSQLFHEVVTRLAEDIDP
jgi:hypothetical protein